KFNAILSNIIFKQFNYPEDIRILERYGKLIQMIDYLNNIENDYKCLPNIRELTNRLAKNSITHCSKYPKINSLAVYELDLQKQRQLSKMNNLRKLTIYFEYDNTIN